MKVDSATMFKGLLESLEHEVLGCIFFRPLQGSGKYGTSDERSRLAWREAVNSFFAALLKALEKLEVRSEPSRRRFPVLVRGVRGGYEGGGYGVGLGGRPEPGVAATMAWNRE